MKEERKRGKANGIVYVMLPFSEPERIALKHEAVDEQRPVRELIRVRLGLPPKVEVSTT